MSFFNSKNNKRNVIGFLAASASAFVVYKLYKKFKVSSLPFIDKTVLNKYAKIPINVNEYISGLNKNEVNALLYLNDACKIIDDIYMIQSTGMSLTGWKDKIRNEFKDNKLIRDITMDEYISFLEINMGLHDRLSDDNHTRKDYPKPKGVNYYPKNMSIDEYKRYIDGLNDDDKKIAQGFYSVIKRDKYGKLYYVEYSEEYEEYLQALKEKLINASKYISNKSLKMFLINRAKAFDSNDYYESEVNWVNINSNNIDLTIGPYEVYEDELLNQKAAFEGFLCVTDNELSKKLELFKGLMQDLENNLPISDEYKNKSVKSGKAIIVVNQIQAGGDNRGGPKPIAFNLPNDERVIKEHSAKLVIINNIQKAKFDYILKPICDVVINDNQKHLVTYEALINQVLCHEICHSLGPHHLIKNINKTVRQALGNLHSSIEEAKADIAGLYCLLYLMRINKLDIKLREQVLITFLCGCFRSIRFGLNESHGKGIAIQLNWMLNKGGFIYNKNTQKYSVNFDKIDDAIKSLTTEILTIQGDGDRNRAELLIKKYAIINEDTKHVLNKLNNNNIPVDIQPQYNWDNITKSD